MKRTYIYDIVNCIVYKEPNWSSRLAMINLSLSLNKLYPETGCLYGLWDCGLKEAKKRGNTIADRLPVAQRERINGAHIFSDEI